MVKVLNIVFLVIFTHLILSCDHQEEKTSPVSKQDISRSMEKANRYLVKTEKEDIENYIRRHGWEMEETGSGLRYMIYEHGSGENAMKGDVAVLKYELSLITGDVVYTSEDRGYKVFLIGKGGVESGLEEAILFMKQGDKARLILPSHLAYGLLGDEDRIPSRATLIYDIELVELN